MVARWFDSRWRADLPLASVRGTGRKLKRTSFMCGTRIVPKESEGARTERAALDSKDGLPKIRRVRACFN